MADGSERDANQPENDDWSVDGSDVRKLADEPDIGLVREFWDFLRYHRKWWLVPLLLALLFLGVFIVLTGSPLAPFIYSFF